MLSDPSHISAPQNPGLLPGHTRSDASLDSVRFGECASTMTLRNSFRASLQNLTFRPSWDNRWAGDEQRLGGGVDSSKEVQLGGRRGRKHPLEFRKLFIVRVI